LERWQAGAASRTSHVLVPCRSDAATVVRRLLLRDLADWEIDPATADGLLIAATEAVGNAVAGSGHDPLGHMLIISWTLTGAGPTAGEAALSFRFSLQERVTPVHVGVTARAHPAAAHAEPEAVVPGACERRAAMRAHPSAGLARGRYVMDALMDRVVVNDGVTGTRILLEKTLS
jgi:hypothetical protein